MYCSSLSYLPYELLSILPSHPWFFELHTCAPKRATRKEQNLYLHSTFSRLKDKRDIIEHRYNRHIGRPVLRLVPPVLLRDGPLHFPARTGQERCPRDIPVDGCVPSRFSDEHGSRD
jgi:hypothetical protein